MLKPVLSTYKILKEKLFNTDIDESWIDWAIEMIQVGYKEISLYELAGISKPFNQFELQELTNKVLEDLNLKYSDRDKVIRDYIYYLISKSINKPGKYINTLRELKDIYINLDLEKEYMKFLLLYFAKIDLVESGKQWYWDGANRKNIDKIINEQFELWVDEFENKKN